jgi:hypothetical protein
MNNDFYNYDIEINPVNTSIIYSAGWASNPPYNQVLYLFISEDYGNSWDTLQFTLGNELYSIKDMELKLVNNDTVKIYLGGSGVYEYIQLLQTGIRNNFINPIR